MDDHFSSAQGNGTISCLSSATSTTQTLCDCDFAQTQNTLNVTFLRICFDKKVQSLTSFLSKATLNVFVTLLHTLPKYAYT